MTLPAVQIDPINSPYPVPWGWVLANLSEADRRAAQFRHYRTLSLISPDGQYAAYSRIQMHLSPQFTQSRVTSVLFLENLQTGNLQSIMPTSPLADNPFYADREADQPGTIAILIPIAWSETGDRILAREFESLFGSGLASDFAVVWHRDSLETYTIAPQQVSYTNAVLLGWSRSDPSRVLFRAGVMGDPEWPQYTVDRQGDTTLAVDDQPIAFGEMMSNLWAGPQAHYV